MLRAAGHRHRRRAGLPVHAMREPFLGRVVRGRLIDDRGRLEDRGGRSTLTLAATSMPATPSGCAPPPERSQAAPSLVEVRQIVLLDPAAQRPPNR
jgi:hypothetical protein